MNDMILSIPAELEWALVLRMALSGAGVLADLPIDLMEDLRTAADEAFDLLTHQGMKAGRITLACSVREDELIIALRAEDMGCAQSCPRPDRDIARQILATLLTGVRFEDDGQDIRGVIMTLPRAGV
jgi:anti-sigma regulatory factor (Ser/Thr protein kinase)